jgi:hypothetical protein
LFQAAQAAANHRGFYPASSVHRRLLALVQAGVTPEHEAFPREILHDYLAGGEHATSEDRRLALERYLAVLDRLAKRGVRLDTPETARFARALSRRCLVDARQPAVLIQRLDQLPRAESDVRPDAVINPLLADWASELEAM